MTSDTFQRSGVSREAEVKRALLVFLPGRRGVSCALEKVLPVDARFSCTLGKLYPSEILMGLYVGDILVRLV